MLCVSWKFFPVVPLAVGLYLMFVFHLLQWPIRAHRRLCTLIFRCVRSVRSSDGATGRSFSGWNQRTSRPSVLCTIFAADFFLINWHNYFSVDVDRLVLAYRWTCLLSCYWLILWKVPRSLSLVIVRRLCSHVRLMLRLCWWEQSQWQSVMNTWIKKNLTVWEMTLCSFDWMYIHFIETGLKILMGVCCCSTRRWCILRLSTSIIRSKTFFAWNSSKFFASLRPSRSSSRSDNSNLDFAIFEDDIFRRAGEGRWSVIIKGYASTCLSKIQACVRTVYTIYANILNRQSRRGVWVILHNCLCNGAFCMHISCVTMTWFLALFLISFFRGTVQIYFLL